MRIITITGIGGSGKDAFVNACREETDVECFSTIDPVKTMLCHAGVYSAFPVDESLSIIWTNETKGPKERALLSAVKNALTEYEDTPYQDTITRISWAHAQDCALCFVMVREYAEMQRFVQEQGAETMLVKRPGIDTCETGAGFTAQYPAGFEFDYVINNDAGLEELAAMANNFVWES